MFPHPAINTYCELVGKVLHVAPATLIENQRRGRRVSEARQLVMALVRATTRLSFQEIGEGLGGRDHTTVIHGVRATHKRIKRDEQFRDYVIAHFPELLQEREVSK